MNLAAGDERNLLVEQIDQTAQDPALRLPAQSEQNKVVPRKHRVDELRHNGFFVPDDSGNNGSPA